MNRTFNPFPIPNAPAPAQVTENPLMQYFRQPSIYIKLPSQGKFYPKASLEQTVTGEFPVFPMTAIDEITYRTPDALFNGEAVVKVIQSCVPNIKNGWDIPATDIDTILVAIRMASYGHEMDFETICPECGAEHDHSLDLRTVLDQMKSPDYTKSIQNGDMEIYFRPMSYKNLNDNNKLQFEAQKILQNVPTTPEETNPDNANVYSQALIRITEITVKALSQSIAAIKTPAAVVSEPDYIEEFLRNCDREVFNKIRDYVINIKADSELQSIPITCADCQHQFIQPITLDMSNFFGVAS